MSSPVFSDGQLLGQPHKVPGEVHVWPGQQRVPQQEWFWLPGSQVYSDGGEGGVE